MSEVNLTLHFYFGGEVDAIVDIAHFAGVSA